MRIHRHARIATLKPTEGDIRDYAFHLYLQSGCVPGRDLENWLEAKASLSACMPKPRAESRTPRIVQRLAEGAYTTESPEAKNLKN